MGTKWSTVSTSTYADNPPSDDGAATEANRIKYATIRSDLTDPLDTAIDSVVANLDALFDEGTLAKSGPYTTVAADHSKIIEVTGAQTITLLDAATAGAGYRVGVKADASSTVTVSRSSTDTIDGVTSFSVAPSAMVLFVVNAAGNGYVTSLVRNITVADASNEALTITQTSNGGGVLIDDTGTGTALTVTNATAQAAGTPIAVVGTPSAAAKADSFSGGILVGGGKYGFAHAQHSTSAIGGPGFATYRSRGTSGAETAVDNGDYTGFLTALAHDGTSYVTSGFAGFSVDETQRSVTTGNIPTKFSVTINDGTTSVVPFTITPSSSAGYGRTTLEGNLTVNGPTGGTAGTFLCEDASYSGLIAYMENSTGYTRLGHTNQYTVYGSSGELYNKSAGTTDSTQGMRIQNSDTTRLFYVRSDGLITMGASTGGGGPAYAPYNFTTTSAANAFLSTDGYLQRSTSSGRFKKNVQPLADEWADKILDLEPVFYESTAPGDAPNPDWTYYGLIAEDVAQVDGRYVHFDTGYRPEDPANKDEDGNPNPIPATPRKPQNQWVADGVQYDRLVVPLINVVKRQRARIEALEAQVSDLTAQMSALADRVAALEPDTEVF